MGHTFREDPHSEALVREIYRTIALKGFADQSSSGW